MNVERAADASAGASRAAELIAAAALEAVAARGSFSLALSGGKTPQPMFEALAHADFPWEATTVFQVDERIAPAGDPARNLTHIVLALAPAQQERLRPMPVGDDDLEAAAARYATELPDTLDLVHLGIGPDGHTASLVPGDAVLEIEDRRVALTAGEYQGLRRMTLTYPALDAARQIVWLVAGEDKRDALARMQRGDAGVPAGRVNQANATLIADDAALG